MTDNPESLLQKARLLMSASQYKEAELTLEPLLDQVRRSESKDCLTQALGTLGICYFETDQTAKARACFEEVLASARASGDNRVIAITLNEIAYVLMKEGKLTEAITVCQEALNLELDRGSEGAVMLHTLAILYQENRQFEEAKEILELVRESCEARHDLAGLGKALNELGLVCSQLDDVPSAVKYFGESIRLKRKTGDSLGITKTLRNMQICLQAHPEASTNSAVLSALEDLENG